MTHSLDELLQIGEFEEAVAIAEARLEEDANDVEARVTLARILLGNEEIEAARAQLVGLADGAGGYPHEVTRASLLAVDGKLEQAETLFRDLANQQPERPEALVGLASVAAERGDAALALKALKKAALAAPGDFWVQYQLGIALAEAGEAERSVECLTKAMELNPADVRPLSALVAALMEAEALDAAEELLREYGEELGENPKSVALLVQVLVAKGELDEARTLAVLNADENPEQPGLQTEAARLLLTTGEREDHVAAVARCQALVTAGTALALTHQVLAQAAELVEDFQSAVTHYTLALGFNGAADDAGLHTNLGLLHLEHGAPADAVAPLEKALALTPESSEALYNVGLLRVALGETAAARTALEAALPLAEPGLKEELARLLSTLAR